MSKNVKKLLVVTAATLAGMYAYNRFVETTATRKNLLKTDGGQFYDWKHGEVFYTKTGNGKPLLLVHDINTKASAEEWVKISKRLAKNHTVYAIDLIGCGRSNKPAIDYTNFLYVQLLSDFVKNVIKESTDVVASNLSAASVLMANNLDSSIFDKIILINPVPINKMEELPNKVLKCKKTLLQVPIVGTFIYNFLNTPAKIDILFKTRYFAKSQLVSSRLTDTYYESAHLGKSKGKFLFASIISNYVNMDIKHALKRLDKPVFIIGSRNLNNNISVMEKYHRTNNNFDITHISNGNLYPQMEIPEKLIKIIEDKLS